MAEPAFCWREEGPPHLPVGEQNAIHQALPPQVKAGEGNHPCRLVGSGTVRCGYIAAQRLEAGWDGVDVGYRGHRVSQCAATLHQLHQSSG